MISITGLVPTTATFADIAIPGNKCLEWNYWWIQVLSRQSDMLPDTSGMGKNVSFGNSIHLGARCTPCRTSHMVVERETPGKYFWRGGSWEASSRIGQQQWPSWMEALVEPSYMAWNCQASCPQYLNQVDLIYFPLWARALKTSPTERAEECDA